jgi:hypothetical protein
MPIRLQKIVPQTAVILILISLLFACKMPKSPEEFFGIAVLNTNQINEFATPRLAKWIQDQTLEFADIPSSKKNGDEALKNVQTTVLVLEQTLQKVKELPENDDTRELRQEAIALYEYVLPVYKNEYTAYAKLCDAKGPKADKDAIIESINQKYAVPFDKMYGAFLQKGKAYAAANNLNVHWD